MHPAPAPPPAPGPRARRATGSEQCWRPMTHVAASQRHVWRYVRGGPGGSRKSRQSDSETLERVDTSRKSRVHRKRCARAHRNKFSLTVSLAH